MKPNDGKLDSLLKQWRGIEPQNNFETNVWRKIHAAEQPVEQVNWIESIGQLLWQPAWSVLAALVVAVAVGVWGGIASIPRQINSPTRELQFLSAGTLMGSYVQMTSREVR